MPNTMYIKMSASDGTFHIKPNAYAELTTLLKSHPNGLVGMEINADGMMQHFFYQAVAVGNTPEIHRYPMRKSVDKYNVVPMYFVLKEREDEYYFDTTPRASSGVKFSEGALFFSEQDKLAIDQLKSSERMQKLQLSETVPFFPAVNLTKQQQEFLYSGQVKPLISFQEELKKLLHDSDTTMEEKELILTACISKRAFKLSAEAAQQVTLMNIEFLKSVHIGTDNASVLCSKEMNGERRPSPTLGAIHDFYIRCIQSHLQIKVAEEELDSIQVEQGLVDAPIDEILQRFPSFKDPAPYKPLSDKDEICLDALHLLLMSQEGENTIEKMKQNVLNNSKFTEVLDDIMEIVSGLKDDVDHQRQTTSKPAYEMIYREFFAIHEISIDSLQQLPSLNIAHEALQVLTLSKKLEALRDGLDDASQVERDSVRDQLKVILNDANPELQQQAFTLLISHHLLSPGEQSGLFGEYVAKGKQDEAEQLLTHDLSAQQLLMRPGIFTDYSGRTFNCTAYEYAYWAKDTHMCRMLERHMNDETRAAMLERIETIERIDAKTGQPVGLVYRQGGREYRSAHFDLTKLTTALNEYVKGFCDWEQRDDFRAMKAAWMKVGLAQRDVPVHVINEYGHSSWSFDPMPTFEVNEDKLPRKTNYYDLRSPRRSVDLYPLVVSGTEGLGVNFALYRGRYERVSRGEWGPLGASGMPPPVVGGLFASLDSEAVTLLDKTRTDELKQSLEILGKLNPGPLGPR